MAKMPAKERTLKPIHANRGVEARYRTQLQALIAEMHASYRYWITAAYRKSPPLMAGLVAQDASPVKLLQRVLLSLGKRWVKRFDEAAEKIASARIRSLFNASDKALQNALKETGFAVDFVMTRPMTDALNASIAANVGLIKSIPQQYLQQVEGVVMRSYAQGRDLQKLAKDLNVLHPAASHRAELIARDQCNKANAVVNQARQLELGITEAIWMHSHAGKNPRPDHVKANGKRYKVAEGCLISGEYIQPGEEINCRCTSRAVLPF